MKSIIVNLLLVLVHNAWAQCGHAYDSMDDLPQMMSNANTFSTNGRQFTPQGVVNVLLFFGGYQDDQLDLSTGFWPGSPGDADFESSLPNYQELFYTELSQFNDTNTDQTVSNFFYQMSKHSPNPLRIIGVPFPHRINLELTDNNINNYSSAVSFTKNMNRRLVDTLNFIYPNALDFGLVDNRTNQPNYEYDNTLSSPDHHIDYTVFFWRTDLRTDPSTLNENTLSQFARVNGFASTGVSDSLEYNGIKYKIGTGFSFVRLSPIAQLYNTFLHELAHDNYDSPHHHGANGVVGHHFYARRGYGMMAPGDGNLINSANAWESWYNGWIELLPNKDIDPSTGPLDVTLSLGDFWATGDAIRIKLPHTGDPNKVHQAQYLWLENRRGNTIFHERNKPTHNKLGQALPPSPDGLLAYIEDCSSSRFEIVQRTNGFKFFHSQGNFDYSLTSTCLDTLDEWWGPVYTVNREQSNPLGSHCPITYFRFDFRTQNGDNILAYESDGSIYNDYGWNRSRTEMFGTGRFDGEFTWQNLGHDMAFQVGQKIGLDQGNVPHNYQHYHSNVDALSPIFLSGLSVEVLSMAEDGTLSVRIRNTDTDITHCTRYTGGDIRLHPVPNAENSLNIKGGATLTLDQSGTASRTQLHPATNDFVPPTLMTVEANALLHLEENGTMVIKNGSTLEIKEDGMVDVHRHATIRIKANSKLIVNDGAKLFIQHGGQVIVEEGGQLIYRNNDPTQGIQFSQLALPPGQEAGHLRIAGTLVVEDSITLRNRGQGFFYFVDNGQFDLGQNSRLIFNGNPDFTEVLRLGENVQLDIDQYVYMGYLTINYEKYSTLKLSHNTARFHKVHFNGFDNYSTTGIQAFSMDYLKLTACQFNDFGQALEASYFGPDDYLTIGSNHFTNCKNSLYFSNIDYVNLFNNQHQFQNLGLQAENVHKIHMRDSHYQVSFTIGPAISLDNVTACYLDNCQIEGYTNNAQNNNGTVGIYSKSSELYLRKNTTIENCGIGVNMEGNAHFNSLLTMGDIGCARIKNCHTAIKAYNTIFNIDAIIHAENNGDTTNIVPNVFENNNLHLNISYQDTAPVSEILLRGNYWNMPLETHVNYELHTVSMEDDGMGYHPLYNFNILYEPTADTISNKCNGHSLWNPILASDHLLWESVRLPGCVTSYSFIKENFEKAESDFKNVDNEHTRKAFKQFAAIPLYRDKNNQWLDHTDSVYTKECVQSIRVAEVRSNSRKCFTIKGLSERLGTTSKPQANSWLSIREECEYVLFMDMLGRVLHKQAPSQARPQLKQGIYLVSQYSSNHQLLETQKIAWR